MSCARVASVHFPVLWYLSLFVGKCSIGHGKAGAGNLQAQPRWFEKTVTKYNKEYKTIITSAINQAKKG